MADRRATFVAWVDRNGRTEDLAEALDIDLHLIASGAMGGIVNAPLKYLRNLGSTRRAVAGDPAGVIVMQPPIFALAAVYLFTRRRRIPIVADIHHAPFEERRWRWSRRPTLWFSRRLALCLVTNPAHAEQLRSAGATVVELHDPPVVTRRPISDAPGTFVVVPSSFYPDEPIEVVLDAARHCSDLSFFVTGRAPEQVRAAAPANVTFTGFVDDDEYHRLIAEAGVVCCLTTKENTMQRGGYEAEAYARPLVTSSTESLRRYFGEGAVYCDPASGKSVAEAIREALRTSAERTARLTVSRQEHRAAFELGLEPVRRALRL